MLVLFLDTASKPSTLALCDEERTLGIASVEHTKDIGIIPAIERLLKKAEKTYSDLTQTACVTGPGGFVSLRIGVAATNTLAYALDLPSAGVHLSDLWARRVRVGVRNKEIPFLWLHSTRRTQIFARGFGTHTTQFPEATLVNLEEAANLRGEYVGELIPGHSKVLSRCTPLQGKDFPTLEETLPGFLKTCDYGKQQLLPWYGRDA